MLRRQSIYLINLGFTDSKHNLQHDLFSRWRLLQFPIGNYALQLGETERDYLAGRNHAYSAEPARTPVTDPGTMAVVAAFAAAERVGRGGRRRGNNLYHIAVCTNKQARKAASGFSAAACKDRDYFTYVAAQCIQKAAST
jgi:hypothetical protein